MNNINTIQSLTQTTFDSVEGYKVAMEKAESPALTSALDRRLNSRQETLARLNTALERQGENRITSKSMSADAHQMFTSISDAFSDGDEAAAKRVEEGEDYIAGKFKNALDDKELDMESRNLLQGAYQEIAQGERFTDMLEKQYS